MKSILLVVHKMNLGGTEKALLSLLYCLREEKVLITLLLLERGGVLESHIPDFVKVEYIESFDNMKPVIEDPPHHTLMKFIKSYQLLMAFRFLFTYSKIKLSGNWYHNYKSILSRTPNVGTYDIAIAFAGPSDFITYFIVNKVTAKKKIQWIHFDIEKIITNYNFGRKFYQYFDKIFCVSQSAKDIFLRNFPEFEGKTEVFHNIVSGPEIKKLAEEGESYPDEYDGIRILTVGRFTKEKGQHLIPEVVTKLKSELFQFRWYFVGDGKEKEDVQNRSIHLDLSGDIIFLGEKENPYPFMKDCDIYVQPSLHEGFGITAEEAKVFNKPIVLTNFASAKDLIENQKTGLIVDISSEGIYEAVKSLMLNESLRNKFSENLSKRKLLSDYDVSKILD